MSANRLFAVRFDCHLRATLQIVNLISLEPDTSVYIVVGSGKLVLSMVTMTLKEEMSFSVIESH